jgi:hypothetical protein
VQEYEGFRAQIQIWFRIDDLKLFFALKIACLYIYIYIQFFIFNSVSRQAIYMFLGKTSYFIAVIIPLTDEIVDWFKLIKPIGRLVPADS